MGLNILQSFQAQFAVLIKRWLSPAYVASWIALTFCGVLFVALWGLLRITNLQDVQGLDQEHIDDAIHQSLELELDFKRQIESWKNLLLRGSDPVMFDRYRREFERSQASIQVGLRDLLSIGHFLEFPTAEPTTLASRSPAGW